MKQLKGAILFCVKLSDVNGNVLSGGQKYHLKLMVFHILNRLMKPVMQKLNINLNPGVYKIITAFSIRNYEDKLLYNTLKVTDTN